MKAGGRRWVVVVVTCATFAGCARSGASVGSSVSDLSSVKVPPAVSPPASELSAAMGTVTGVARMYGGPFVNGKMADDGNPGSGITLTATQNGRPVASMTTGAAGSYRFMLPPGNYVVTGCADLAVVVVAGQVNDQDIGCPIP